MAAIAVNLSGLDAATRRGIKTRLQDEHQARYLLAKRAQLLAAKEAHDRPQKFVGLLGPTTLHIHPYMAGLARRSYGQNIMADPDFATWLRKRHPEYKVDARTGRTVVTNPGGPGTVERTVKFRKAYSAG